MKHTQCCIQVFHNFNLGAVTPLLANGINVPYFLLLGALVLVPLMAFEVFVESAILRWGWRVQWSDLVRLTLRANLWSLVAGIPVKILNAVIYDAKLPKDLPGFFEAYPLWIGIGTGIYFVVTVAVETLYAFRIVGEAGLSKRRIFCGMLMANVVTYAVLATVYFAATKPDTGNIQFTRDAKWANEPAILVLFTDATNSHLKVGQVDGTEMRAVVPHPVSEYQVSKDLKLCLYRNAEGNLYLYNAETLKTKKVFESASRIGMDQSAFSPSGRYVALLPSRNRLVVADLESGNQRDFTFPKKRKPNAWRGRAKRENSMSI